MSAEKKREEKCKSEKESSCYFCGELFEMGQIQHHLKQCGSILEQCPLRCGAWIQRKHKEKHVDECPKMDKNREAGLSTHARLSDPSLPSAVNHTWSPQSVSLEDCVSYLEKEVAAVKLVVTEESSHRDVQSTELENLRTKIVLLEERSQHFLSTLMSLRATVDDEADRTANWTAQFKHDMANVQLALQELQSQQLSTVMRLETAVSSIVHEQNERELLEQALTQHDNRIRAVYQLQEVIEYIKNTVEEERQVNAESRAALEAEMLDARRSSQQVTQLANLREQLEIAAGAERPAVDRLAVLELATASARADASENSHRMEVIARDLKALTKSYLKMRNDLVDFQARVSFDRNELGADDGHLIWRIDNFTARMKEAKTNDAVLSSPIFRTSKYGYTLKAEVNLNGIGKWKGRNITCTLRLVSGPYDTLLRWPCDLHADLILRDQAGNTQQSVDIVKTLELRRKSSSKRHDFDASQQTNKQTEPADNDLLQTIDKSILQLKRQYIFIPHTSLDKFDYIKNDVMFLEFIVKE